METVHVAILCMNLFGDLQGAQCETFTGQSCSVLLREWTRHANAWAERNRRTPDDWPVATCWAPNAGGVLVRTF